MYAWAFGINGLITRGRTWTEFILLLTHLVKHYDINLNKRFIIYIHNLSYEFQFIKNYFEWETVFALDTRKPVYAVTKQGIEFRCSYLLSGFSLEKLGEQLTKYKQNKKVGDLDYNLIRHSYTPLTEKEWGYIGGDCLVVMSHIQEELERLGSIDKLPLTKTGYVRDLCRERTLKGTNKWGYSKLIKNLTLGVDEYQQLKKAYTGGFTHANIHYVDKIIKDVYSIDFTSSYPAVMLSEKYPMSKAYTTTITNNNDLKNMVNAYCCVFNVTFYNIGSKVDFENYISISRCYQIQNYIANNGRVVEADILSMTLTEQDFKIINIMYSWDKMEISQFRYYEKDYLPKEIIEVILELYEKKTSLKGVDYKVVEYMVSKGMINSLYGMCVTDPCRDENVYTTEWVKNNVNIAEALKTYNQSRTRFLYYPWGVWVTAYARKNLFTGIIEFGNDYVYSDTDSIKCINYEKHLEYINKYNNDIKNKISKCLKHYNIDDSKYAPKTIKGVSKPLGVWDFEGKYKRFKTLGAKRYMYEDDDLHITIAGVNKKAGVEYLKRTYKNNDNIFKAFKEDISFPPEYSYQGKSYCASGKLCHTYIDDYIQGEVIDYLGKKAFYSEQSGVHLENTEYTLSLDDTFVKLLQGIKEEELC